MTFRSAGRIGVLTFLFVLSGCLPHSCDRTETRALMPADSLSRQMASRVEVDTLNQIWMSDASELAYPRTIRFTGADQIYVSDVESHRLFAFGTDGAMMETVDGDDLHFPYLIGVRGDTALVFNPARHRIDFVAGGAVVRSIDTPSGEALPRRQPLQYAAAADSALFVKIVGEEFDSYIARLGPEGQIQERFELQGPFWRFAGQLRPWGDSLVSLSGYRPVVDVLPAEAQQIDTLRLHGFDSPMLSRSRLFLAGEVDEAPLLSASAAAAGDLLFVLNMRPGWLRIDAFDRQGRLQHRLVQPNPRARMNTDYYPVDLDVRRVQGGAYEFAVAVAKPEPRIELYRWRPTPPPVSGR